MLLSDEEWENCWSTWAFGGWAQAFGEVFTDEDSSRKEWFGIKDVMII